MVNLSARLDSVRHPACGCCWKGRRRRLFRAWAFVAVPSSSVSGNRGQQYIVTETRECTNSTTRAAFEPQIVPLRPSINRFRCAQSPPPHGRGRDPPFARSEYIDPPPTPVTRTTWVHFLRATSQGKGRRMRTFGLRHPTRTWRPLGTASGASSTPRFRTLRARPHCWMRRGRGD